MRMPLLIPLMVALASAANAVSDESKGIQQLIDDINAGARTNKTRMVRILVLNTDVAAETLDAEKKRTGFSYGDIYVAHSLALATRKSFDQIAAFKRNGLSWAQIAQMHNCSLKGSTAALRQMLKE